MIEKVKKISKDILDNNQDLKDSLKEAQDRLKDLEKEQTSSDKGFWRKEIVIPIILVLVVAVFVGVIFWTRRKKKEN